MEVAIVRRDSALDSCVVVVVVGRESANGIGCVVAFARQEWTIESMWVVLEGTPLEGRCLPCEEASLQYFSAI